MTPLHHFGEWLRQALLAVPLPAARLLFVVTLAAVLVWVVFLPRHAVVPQPDSVRPTENLKWWASLALIIQLAIYVLI